MDFERIRSFVESYIEDDSEKLELLRENARNAGVPIIRRDAADYLKLVLADIKPARILEIGTAVGYSALYMSEQLGRMHIAHSIDTIEYDEVRADTAEKNFKDFGKTDIIRLFRGDAAEVLKEFTEQNSEAYDLVFIDAAKAQYMIYLDYVMNMVHPGSVIVTDNIFESGLVLESHFLVEKRDRTIHDRIREYIERIKKDERLETAILSIGDGIAVSVVTGNDR